MDLCNKLMFFLGKPYYSSLMFAGKAGAHQTEALFGYSTLG